MGDSTPQYAHNHITNPETGFLENPAYVNAFDSAKKKLFLELYEQMDTDLYGVCEKMGIRYETVNKHYQLDPKFKRLFDEAEFRYAHKLQAVGRKNALNPRSVVERIWIQKSLSYLPGFEKYSEQKNLGNVQINVNIDSNQISDAINRLNTVDAELVSTQEHDVKPIDTHKSESATNER
jgi:hypothetical protein